MLLKRTVICQIQLPYTSLTAEILVTVSSIKVSGKISRKFYMSVFFIPGLNTFIASTFT